MGEGDGGEIEGGVEAVGVEEKGVDVGVGELVDEDGEAEVAAVVDEVPDERRLAAAEESGDEGAAHAAAGEPRPAVEDAVLKGHSHLVAFHFSRCLLLVSVLSRAAAIYFSLFLGFFIYQSPK